MAVTDSTPPKAGCFKLSGILQLLFNAADIVVVGRFAGSESLAAVGATGSLTNKKYLKHTFECDKLTKEGVFRD